MQNIPESPNAKYALHYLTPRENTIFVPRKVFWLESREIKKP